MGYFLAFAFLLSMALTIASCIQAADVFDDGGTTTEKVIAICDSLFHISLLVFIVKIGQFLINNNLVHLHSL